MQNNKPCWVVAYVDVGHIKNVEIDLGKKPIYKDVKAYIPTVKILKKTFKGVESFEEVPLLFNYGFFSIPLNQAKSKTFLDNMKQDVSCIFGWVSDPAKVVARKPILYADNICIYTEQHVQFATATSEEIIALISMARESTIFSAVELDRVNVGDTITLKGYPWDNMDATVLSIDHKKQKLHVSLKLFQQMKDIQVSFDSVFFTVYNENNHNPDKFSKYSLDAIVLPSTKDKITFNLHLDGN